LAYVILGLTTTLARSGTEAGRMILQGGYDGLLLDFPQELEGTVDSLRSGAPLEAAEEAVDQLLGGYSKSWLYRNRPVLESLRDMPEAEVVCTGRLEEEGRMMEDRMSLALLEYRTMVGRVVVSRWREALRKASRNLHESVVAQGRRILKAIREGGRWLCIAGVYARRLEQTLRSHGHPSAAVLLGRPYLGTPLEALSAELAEGDPSDERVRYLVELHLDFLRNYVMVSPALDEAYDSWLENGEWAKLYHYGSR